MSLALIQESAKEVRRLAIAGSPLAVGDFRLKKLIPPLEQAGAKVPVFGQVAKAISDLVNGKEAQSAANLLNLSTLLNAILYTQGQTGVEGDCRELEIYAARFSSTKTSARVLKPLLEALTTAGEGHFKVVKDAVDRGAFNDLRLIEPAIRALDHNYAELADLVAEKVLPGYGPGIVPLLREKLDLKGKKSDARRLRILHHLDKESSLELCKTALDEGSPDVKAAAIGCLGKYEECLPLVIEQSKSKNKTVRAAALEALAEHDRPEITKLFTDLIKGKSLDQLTQPLRLVRNREVLRSLLAEGKRAFDLLLKNDEEQLGRYWETLACLGGRKEAEVEEFLLGCFDQCEKLAKVKVKKSIIAGADVMERLASLLYDLGSPKAFEAMLAKRNVLSPAAFTHVLRSAIRTWPADKVYVEFAPVLEQKKGAGKERSEQLQRTVVAAAQGNLADLDEFYELEDDSPDADALKKVQWDARWLDAAIKADALGMVCALARPGHQPTIACLLKAIDSPKNRYEVGSIMQVLARCQYPKLTDFFLEQVKKRTKNAGAFHYELGILLRSARYLPSADLARLDEFASKLDEKFVNPFLEALAPLRQAEPARLTQAAAGT